MCILLDVCDVYVEEVGEWFVENFDWDVGNLVLFILCIKFDCVL